MSPNLSIYFSVLDNLSCVSNSISFLRYLCLSMNDCAKFHQIYVPVTKFLFSYAYSAISPMSFDLKYCISYFQKFSLFFVLFCLCIIFCLFGFIFLIEPGHFWGSYAFSNNYLFKHINHILHFALSFLSVVSFTWSLVSLYIL